MLIQIGRSFVGRTVLIIAALISIMAALLFYCNLYATWAVRERASDSYLSMGKYYTKDLDTKLYAIAEYLAGSSMELDFQTIVYADAQNRKDKYALAKEALYLQLSQDILMYKPVEYFFIYSPKDMMLVPSTTQTRTLDSIEMKEGLSALLETVIQRANRYNSQWELGYIHGERYIYRYLWFQDTCLGACVSEKQLLEIFRDFSLSDYEVLFQTGESGEENISDDDLLIRIPSEYGNFDVVIRVPSERLYEELHVFLYQSLFIILLLIILLPVFFLYLHHIMIVPIRSIVNTMREVGDGATSIRIPPIKKLSEFQLVAKTFNNMMDQMEQLKIDIYEKKIAEQELYIQCSKLQINPHFFLNSLNTLYLLNKRREHAQINKILTYLLDYFRNVFSGKGDIVRLEDEVNLVLSYAAVQRFRYDGNIHIQYEVEETAEEVPVPSMVMLTFVENAIKYSTNYSKELNIRLYAALSEDQLVIQIEDDGGGFPEEILQALREGKPIYKEDREHIGISNVVSRLKLYYGQEASITFENMESSGARVCIKLPRRNSNEITTC